ncbi:hypothetical protein HDU96_010599 [Phlyctochytrium bullatum]|nr:hypothetical protein HDU96_010599 [Phlyctochytrium bullatum]
MARFFAAAWLATALAAFAATNAVAILPPPLQPASYAPAPHAIQATSNSNNHHRAVQGKHPIHSEQKSHVDMVMLAVAAPPAAAPVPGLPAGLPGAPGIDAASQTTAEDPNAGAIRVVEIAAAQKQSSGHHRSTMGKGRTHGRPTMDKAAEDLEEEYEEDAESWLDEDGYDGYEEEEDDEDDSGALAFPDCFTLPESSVRVLGAKLLPPSSSSTVVPKTTTTAHTTTSAATTTTSASAPAATAAATTSTSTTSAHVASSTHAVRKTHKSPTNGAIHKKLIMNAATHVSAAQSAAEAAALSPVAGVSGYPPAPAAEELSAADPTVNLLNPLPRLHRRFGPAAPNLRYLSHKAKNWLFGLHDEDVKPVAEQCLDLCVGAIVSDEETEAAPRLTKRWREGRVSEMDGIDADTYAPVDGDLQGVADGDAWMTSLYDPAEFEPVPEEDAVATEEEEEVAPPLPFDASAVWGSRCVCIRAGKARFLRAAAGKSKACKACVAGPFAGAEEGACVVKGRHGDGKGASAAGKRRYLVLKEARWIDEAMVKNATKAKGPSTATHTKTTTHPAPSSSTAATTTTTAAAGTKDRHGQNKLHNANKAAVDATTSAILTTTLAAATSTATSGWQHWVPGPDGVNITVPGGREIHVGRRATVAVVAACVGLALLVSCVACFVVLRRCRGAGHGSRVGTASSKAAGRMRRVRTTDDDEEAERQAAAVEPEERWRNRSRFFAVGGDKWSSTAPPAGERPGASVFEEEEDDDQTVVGREGSRSRERVGA